MNKNTRYFNTYIFLTTFARQLLEVFIGTFLYKMGFSLQAVLLYYVLVMGFSIIIAIPCFHMCKKHSNRLLWTFPKQRICRAPEDGLIAR